jgi:hypothetical protein
MTWRWPALSCALTVCLASTSALAFKEAGHRGIEAAAYAELAATPSGQGTLGVLLDYGILKAPGRPVPLSSVVLDPGYQDYRVDALLSQAHMPDHLMDRQLQADRQCFHFNARGAHTTLTDASLAGFPGVPRGLVVDAYVECIGIADALLRGILFDPMRTHADSTDIYSLMHMIEDSYSDAHVARSGPVKPFTSSAVDRAGQNQILFIKPWNLRTWSRYMLGSSAREPVYLHFSDSHHMTSDSRDLGYLLGPTDEDYASKSQFAAYRDSVTKCLVDARPRIRPRSSSAAKQRLSIEDLYGDVIPPESCLSERALAAKQALVALLKLVAAYAPLVTTPGPVGPGHEHPETRNVGVNPINHVSFEGAWLGYRRRYLGHRLDSLTVAMTMWGDPSVPPGDNRVVPSQAEAQQIAARSLRRDRVMPAPELAPRDFKEAGFGLGVEVRGGTPLWLGLDEFVTRKSANHNRTVVLLDTLGWSIQARLPIENELGERPVGAAGDLGPALPLPLSELISLEVPSLLGRPRSSELYGAGHLRR